MKINEIILELATAPKTPRLPGKSYEKLDRLRNIARPPEIEPHSQVDLDDEDNAFAGKNYRDDAVGVVLPGRLKGIQTQTQNSNTGFSGRGQGRFSGEWDEMYNLFTRNEERGKEILDKFKVQAEERDYVPRRIVYKNVPQISITTRNNVIVKINVGQSAGATNISVDQLPKKIKDTESYTELWTDLRQKYPEPKTKKEDKLKAATNGDVTITPIKKDIDGILSEFWQIVGIVEGIPDLDPYSGSTSTNQSDNISQSRANLDYYIGAAELIRTAYVRRMSHLRSRGGTEGGKGTFDVNDSVISKAISIEGNNLLKLAREKRLNGEPIPEKGRPYREHAVPGIYLWNLGLQMYKDKKSVEEVADMLRRNLIIVYIGHDEARKMDIEMKLRTTMPAGWKDGDSPLARLKAAGIKVYRLSDGKRLSE